MSDACVMKQQTRFLSPVGNKEHGGLLIEVMVCALLLAAGILAVLASQSTGVQSARGAYFYLQAESLVSDMVDRIQANPDSVGNYVGTTNQFSRQSMPNCVNSNAGCNRANRARADRVEWANMFNAASRSGQSQELLPRGLGRIIVDGEEVTVWVQWRQDDSDGVRQLTNDCGAVRPGFRRVCAHFRI